MKSPKAMCQTDISRKLVIALLYLFISMLILSIFILKDINGNQKARVMSMVNGSAHQPFCYRILVPGLIRIISYLTPDIVRISVNAWIKHAVEQRRILKILFATWEHQYYYEYSVTALILLFCFIGLAYSLRAAIRQFYSYPGFVADLAPCFGLSFIPIFFKYTVYIYDPMTLLLFTLAIVTLRSNNRIGFYLTFLAACFNKETSVLMIGLFLVRQWQQHSSTRHLTNVAILSAIWISVRMLLLDIFRNNPGRIAEFHLLDHNIQLPCNQPGSFAFLGGAIAASVLLISPGWETKPLLLRRGLMVVFIPLLALTFFFGYIDEIRDYLEAYPFVFLLALPTLVRLFDIDTSEARISR